MILNENIESGKWNRWFKGPNSIKESIIVLQSNDYDKLDSHINCQESLEEFCNFVKPSLSKEWIISKSQIDLGDFNRFMVIGQWT